jgi:hypothetical protein
LDNQTQDQKRTSPCIIVKTLNIQNKERILKSRGEKHQVTFKGKPVIIMADFSTETLKARKIWDVGISSHERKYLPT